MKVIMDSMLQVQDVPVEIMDQIKKELTIKNPSYALKMAIGLNKWACGEEYIRLWEKVKKDGKVEYVLPRGYAQRLWEIVGHLEPEWESKRVKFPVVEFPLMPKLRDYQLPVLEKANFQGVIIAPCGSGKGHPLNTKIYTPKGCTTIGELKVGDLVFGSDGKPVKVTDIFDRGILPTYRVKFSDGTSLLCDEDHIWTVQSQCCRNTTGNWQTKTTKELFSGKLYMGKDAKHNRSKWYIPVVEPVQFESKKIPVDPYFLGVWLGDGCSKNGHLHITNAEPDIINRIKKSVELSQYEYNEYGVINASEIEKEMRELGLIEKESHEKFIPQIYKYNTVDIRLKVLQGLMDTDGSVDKWTFSFTSTSKQLAYDVLEIVQSLGGTGKIAERQTYYTNYGYKKAGMKSYRLHFKLMNFMPFASKKHNSKFVPRTKYTKIYRNIKSIEYAGDMPIRCISVDAPNKLYVAENFIVTHNTEMGMAIAANLGQPTLWITHTMDLLKQSMDRAIDRLGLTGREIGVIQGENMSIGSHMTFATVQTLARRDLSKIKNKFGCVIVDEAHLVFKDDKKFRMFAGVINQLPAFYRFGLTASEHRSDGLIETMFHIIGPKIYEVPQDDPRLNVMAPRVEFVETDFEYFQENGELFNVQQMYRAMREDIARDAKIKGILYYEISESDSCLVLGDSLEHLESLQMFFKALWKRTAFIHGNTPKKERERTMEDMRSGRCQYLFATYQLAKLGLDIPRLNKLVLVTPKRDKTSVQQAVGRIMRPFEGKTQPVVYDIYDSKVPQLRHWARERVRVYKALGCDIVGGPKVRK